VDADVVDIRLDAIPTPGLRRPANDAFQSGHPAYVTGIIGTVATLVVLALAGIVVFRKTDITS
jgi:hypothetical protein